MSGTKESVAVRAQFRENTGTHAARSKTKENQWRREYETSKLDTQCYLHRCSARRFHVAAGVEQGLAQRR
jgi:hypothetical protein